MQYLIRAVSSEHLVVELTLEANDEADARRQIAARGWFATAIAPARESMAQSWLPGLRRPPALSLVLFSQELLALLKAGLGIVEGLEALLEKEPNPATRSILERLLGGLRDGQRFSAVLAAQPEIFPPLYVGIVKAAEGTSDLPQSLTRYIDYQQRIDSVRNKIVSAALYPLILLAVGGGVSAFLIAYVVPRFAQVYQGTGKSLPWMSQVMLDWGQFASNHTGALIASTLALALLGLLALRRAIAQGVLLRQLMRLPGIGERVRIYELARLYLTLGMLLEGGLAVVPVMQTVEAMVKADMRSNLQAAAASISSGEQLSTAFEANHLTTPISLRMLRVGERTGELGHMLTQSAAFYDGEISRWIERFTRTFEPLLMTAIGIVVGAIVVLLYMPIFDLAGSLS